MKVYRFEKNTEERLQTIQNGEIYLSRPENFNDLEDCKIKAIFTPQFNEVDYLQIKSCIEILYSKEGYFPLIAKVLRELKEYFSYAHPYTEDAGDRLWGELKQSSIINTTNKYLRNSTGVCCFFNGAPKHPLMWAHYANNHTGFCLEYEIDNSEDNPLLEVNYTTKPLTPSIHELLLCPHEVFTNILTTKSFEWNYEKEFRLIYLNEFQLGEKGKNIALPKTMKLKRLITGAKFSESNNKQLIGDIKKNIKTESYKKFISTQKQ